MAHGGSAERRDRDAPVRESVGFGMFFLVKTNRLSLFSQSVFGYLWVYLN